MALPVLQTVQSEIDACRVCPDMIGPPVHGPPVKSHIFLLGQAPGPHEGKFGRPFAWTAGKTLFKWFERSFGADEATFRERVYMAAVARCFPGKTKGGGDRVPSPFEIDQCRGFLEREVAVLQPRLVIAIGRLAIEQVTGKAAPLAEVIGKPLRLSYHGVTADVIALPHPSGASTWFKMEPGKSLLEKALKRLGRHAEIRAVFGAPGSRRRAS